LRGYYGNSALIVDCVLTCYIDNALSLKGIAMKIFVIAFLVFFSSVASAKGASKLYLCMEAAYAASVGFEMKQQGKRLVYPQIKDPIIRLVMHRAMYTGFNANTSQEAIQQGHDKCAESPIWAEINYNKELYEIDLDKFVKR
jgi:hypothetical protein